jgi:hypothetical protein
VREHQPYLSGYPAHNSKGITHEIRDNGISGRAGALEFVRNGPSGRRVWRLRRCWRHVGRRIRQPVPERRYDIARRDHRPGKAWSHGQSERRDHKFLRQFIGKSVAERVDHRLHRNRHRYPPITGSISNEKKPRDVRGVFLSRSERKAASCGRFRGGGSHAFYLLDDFRQVLVFGAEHFPKRLPERDIDVC